MPHLRNDFHHLSRYVVPGLLHPLATESDVRLHHVAAFSKLDVAGRHPFVAETSHSVLKWLVQGHAKWLQHRCTSAGNDTDVDIRRLDFLFPAVHDVRAEHVADEEGPFLQQRTWSLVPYLF